MLSANAFHLCWYLSVTNNILLSILAFHYVIERTNGNTYQAMIDVQRRKRRKRGRKKSTQKRKYTCGKPCNTNVNKKEMKGFFR